MNNLRCPQCEAPHLSGAPSCDQCGFPLPEWSEPQAELPKEQVPSTVSSSTIPAKSPEMAVPLRDESYDLKPVSSEPPPLTWDEPKIPLPDNTWKAPKPDSTRSSHSMPSEPVDIGKVNIPLPETSWSADTSDSVEPIAPAIAPPALQKTPLRWKLVVVEGFTVEKEYLIYKETMILGRRDAEQSVFPDIDLEDQDDGFISRKHAVIRLQKGSLLIEDLGGENGTFVDGEPLKSHELVSLKEGQVLRLGRVGLWVQRCPVREKGEWR